MKFRRFTSGVAVAAAIALSVAVAGEAHAGGKVNLTVTNGASLPMYIETIGDGLTCWYAGIPATTIPARSGRTFQVEASDAGGCAFQHSQAVQTVVYGPPGKQEVRAFFAIRLQPSPAGPTTVQIGGAEGPHIASSVSDPQLMAPGATVDGWIAIQCDPNYCGR